MYEWIEHDQSANKNCDTQSTHTNFPPEPPRTQLANTSQLYTPLQQIPQPLTLLPSAILNL